MERVLGTALALCLFSFEGASGEAPSFDNDYGRSDIGGKHWESMLHGDGLEGWRASEGPFSPSVWRREGDTIVADTGEANRARLVQGDSTWTAYEFKVQATIKRGTGPQLVFGVSDHGVKSHFLTYLTGWKTMVVVRRNEETHEDIKLDVVDFVMEREREYDFVVKVRDHSVTAYIDGELVNRLTMPNPNGAVGLAVWGHNSTVHFRDPKVRHYYKRHTH
jgi:hypothetical protein